MSYQEPELNVGALIPQTGSSSPLSTHKLTVGDNIFRILPPFGTNHNGSPFAEHRLHWFQDDKGNKRPLSCSYGTERYCPVCSAANEIYTRMEEVIGDYKDENKRIKWDAVPEDASVQYNELREQFSAVRVQRGYFYNAINKSGELKILRLPKTAAEALGQKILEAVQKLSFNPLSLKTGCWFNIKQIKTGKNRFNVKYEVEFVQTPQTLENGQTALILDRGPAPQNLIDNYDKLAIDVHVLYPERTGKQLKRAMEGDATLWAELDKEKAANKAKVLADSNVGEEGAAPTTTLPPKEEVTKTAAPAVPKTEAPVTKAPAPEAATSAAPAAVETKTEAPKTPAPPVAAVEDEEDLEKLKADLGL